MLHQLQVKHQYQNVCVVSVQEALMKTLED